MTGGRIVEEGSAAEVTSNPQEAYTRRLILAAPVPDPARQAVRRAEFRALSDESLEGEACLQAS
jgi:peptide/nickel transport system ATP-binding protein